jgi:hypothetical protein
MTDPRRTGRLAPWAVWSPRAAPVAAAGYGTVQAYWAVAGAPRWVLGFDVVISGWPIVAVCVAGAAVVLGRPRGAQGRMLIGATLAVAAVLAGAAAPILLDVVGGLLPGLGIPRDGAGFLSRATCLAVGVLVGATALSWRRQRPGACPRCGRTGPARRRTGTPLWAYAAAYAAVAGFAARVTAQLALTDAAPFAAGTSLVVFDAGFVLAGVLLPLAQVHSWGRIWPRWIVPLAGRAVPRWIVAGPGFAVAAALCGYFGVALVQMIVGSIDGSLQDPRFMWVAVLGYVLWGCGLALATSAYHGARRPRCIVCGR